MVKIELFSASGCNQCDIRQDKLRAIAESVLGADKLSWRQVNVLEELDYAVSLGVLNLPTLAVNGQLLFPSLPDDHQLRAALERVIEKNDA